MHSGPERVTRSANNAPVADETTITNLRVAGELPAALLGQYMRIGPNRIDTESLPADWADGEGMVHAVTLAAGRAISYRNRWITTDAVAQKLAVDPTPGPRGVGDDVIAANLITFGSCIFAFGDGALAYELNARLDTVRRVDLAGAGRSLVADCKVDSHTGQLHLLTSGSVGSQLHVAVSRGALTRTIRSIDDAPSRIRQIELTSDEVVLVADGFVGVAARAGVDMKPVWFEIDTDARRITAAYAHGDTVVAYSTGPSFVRWTLDRRAAIAHSEVLDPAVQAIATSNWRRRGAAQDFLWTVGAGTAHKHDLVTGQHGWHDFGDGRTPGELVFVADPDRSGAADGGWLVGFVHDEAGEKTEFVVLDAQSIERPAVAIVHIPRRVPTGARATWIAAARRSAPSAT
jgi:carotenoid cleavage dioxygenase-like enzyme